MSGIPLLNLGAMPALPSPATGIVPPNPLTQLAQAAGQFPAQQQAAVATKQKNELAQTQIEDAKRKQAQDRYDRTIQMVKNNPALGKSPVIVKQLQDDAKILGIPAPIVGGPSATAIPGAAPTGLAAPGGAAPGAAPAGGVDATATDVGGGPPPAPAGPTGPSVDMQAIIPRIGYSEWAANPSNVKEANLLSPAQRRASYGNLFSPGDPAPESFFNSPKSWDQGDTQKLLVARTMMQQAMQKGDKNSILAAVKFMMPQFADDPSFDPSSLIDPTAFETINQNENRKLDILKQANVIKEDVFRDKHRKLEADLGMMHTREGLMAQVSKMNEVKLKYLPLEQQARIDGIRSSITKRADDTKHATDTLNETIRNHNISSLDKDRAAAGSAVKTLVTQQDALRNEARALYTAGMDDLPDPQDPTKSLVQTLGEQIVGIQGQIDATNKTIADSNDPNIKKAAIKAALPGATEVHSKTPPDVIAKAKAHYLYLPPDRRAAWLADPRIPDDVRKLAASW